MYFTDRNKYLNITVNSFLYETIILDYTVEQVSLFKQFVCGTVYEHEALVNKINGLNLTECEGP
jgi:hypothetical protein